MDSPRISMRWAYLEMIGTIVNSNSIVLWQWRCSFRSMYDNRGVVLRLLWIIRGWFGGLYPGVSPSHSTTQGCAPGSISNGVPPCQVLEEVGLPSIW